MKDIPTISDIGVLLKNDEDGHGRDSLVKRIEARKKTAAARLGEKLEQKEFTITATEVEACKAAIHIVKTIWGLHHKLEKSQNQTLGNQTLEGIG